MSGNRSAAASGSQGSGPQGSGPPRSGPQRSEPQRSEPQRERRRAIWIVIAGAALVLVIVAMVAVGLGGAWDSRGSEASPSPEASAPNTASTPSAAPSASPGATPSVDPNFGQPVADTVPKDQSADFGDQVTARIAALTGVTAKGTLAGEVSGPAVQLDLAISNGTAAEISLGTVTVNAYYGADKTPAAPYSQPSDAAFPGTLAAGATVQARYLFSVPESEQGSVVITVSKSAGEPIVVFQ